MDNSIQIPLDLPDVRVLSESIFGYPVLTVSFEEQYLRSYLLFLNSKY